MSTERNSLHLYYTNENIKHKKKDALTSFFPAQLVDSNESHY